jgi:hypothetical protein
VVFGFGASGRRCGGETLQPAALFSHPVFEGAERPLLLLPIGTGGIALLAVSSVDGPMLAELGKQLEVVLEAHALGRELEQGRSDPS